MERIYFLVILDCNNDIVYMSSTPTTKPLTLEDVQTKNLTATAYNLHRWVYAQSKEFTCLTITVVAEMKTKEGRHLKFGYYAPHLGREYIVPQF